MSSERVFIETKHGQLHGMINYSSKIGHIESLSVNSSLEYRKGYGTELYNLFLAKLDDFKLIHIEIFRLNDRAIKFWESKGFKYDCEQDEDYLEYSLKF